MVTGTDSQQWKRPDAQRAGAQLKRAGCVLSGGACLSGLWGDRRPCEEPPLFHALLARSSHLASALPVFHPLQSFHDRINQPFYLDLLFLSVLPPALDVATKSHCNKRWLCPRVEKPLYEQCCLDSGGVKPRSELGPCGDEALDLLR